jgi:hypothetical protein
LALISATLFLELVGGLGLEGLSVGSKGCPGSLLNLGILGDVHFNVILCVFGASEGSGTSFLLLRVKLLDLRISNGGELLVVGGEGGSSELLVVVGEGGGSGELLVVGGEGGGDELLGNFVLDSSFTCSLPGVHN